ncbi:MAG: hypothetical protein ACTTKH_06500 [Treponema sp.]
MKKLIHTFIIFLLSVTFLSSQEYESTPISILDELKTQIENTHPAPYTNVSKKDFEAQIETLKKTWHKQDEMQQYFSLCHLVALIGDAHTQIFKPLENDKALPFFVLPYGGHSIIVQAEKEYTELVGKELIAINGIKLKTIFQKLFSIISHDKKEWANLKAHYGCRLFSRLKYIGGIKKDETAKIKYKDISTGKTKTMNVDFSKDMQINNPVFANLSQTLFQSGYYYANIFQDILFIQYNVCADSPDMPMKDFAFRIGQLPKPKKIIVDLRHNTGGDSRVIGPLLEVLNKISPNNEIPIFAFVGNGTFSSGVMAAYDLKTIGALLIGEEMGWNGKFGEVKEIQLNDDYVLFCSTKDFSEYLKDMHPDLIMLQDLKSLNAGVDSLVEAIKNLSIEQE